MGCCFSSDYAGQNGLPFVKVGESTPTATTENKGVNHVFTSTASTPNVSAGSTSSRKIAVAIYDYAPPEEGLYLGIVKGEKLEVIEAHDSDWWRVRSLKTGREGYVPTNYIADDQSVESEDWFFGNVSRKEAEDLLMKPGNNRGTFLVRHSEQNPGSYALSIKDVDEALQEKVKHYKVQIHPETGEFYLAPRHGFPSLRCLVSACMTNKHGLCHLLVKPCPRPKPQIWDLSPETRDHWELNRGDIQLIRKLGSGHFGVVWYGLWKGQVEVAVKTMKPGSTSTECFLKEASIMKKFRHDRIVTLYGVCTREEPIYIVTEFMCKGSLLDLLRSPEGATLTFEQLLYIGSQVASGMAYLEKLCLVHRDLAARNIVVGENNVAKVADFGLARVTENNEYFRREGTQVPVKWTAPEVIHYGKYSIKSDVWSFGILMMELFTYGQDPYAGMNKSQVIKKLETGYRMPKPVNVTFPDSLYKSLVLPCWDSDPDRRPTFQYAHNYLDEFMVSSESWPNRRPMI